MDLREEFEARVKNLRTLLRTKDWAPNSSKKPRRFRGT